MVILHEKISKDQLCVMAAALLGDMVKAVVDIERNLIALDAELHSDLEGLLLQEGSKQSHLWGINLYPELTQEDFLEFDSMINVRPSQGNMSRGVDRKDVRNKIIQVVEQWISD